MKKGFVLLGALMVSISAYSFIQSHLLEESDFQLQEVDNLQGPAMGSALIQEDGWASYNEWQCFSLGDAKLECAIYDEDTRVPAIQVATENHVYLFDTHVEDNLSCDETLLKWNELADGGKKICIFAAYMPDVNLESDDEGRSQSLWYINQVKLAGGYWKLFDESKEY